MKPKVYLETTIASLLTAWPSRDVLIAGQQQADAAHIATAAVHGMEFLLTWNCRHIANATIVEKLRSICEREGFPAPVICTPHELMV